MPQRSTAVLIFAILISFSVSFETEAAIESYSVMTARGIQLELSVEKPLVAQAPLPVLILAPGQACNSQAAPTEVLDRVAEDARRAGYATLRFQWAYCQSQPPTLPSPFFVDEIEDLESALSFVKGNSTFDQENIVLGGKTQGSFVAYRAFLRQPNVRALALLTPVCTYTVDNDNQPLPAPIMVGYENYPYLNLQRRPILVLAGSKDKSCLISALDDLLRETSPNVEKSVINGDHAFRTFDDDGTVNESQTSRNIGTAAKSLTRWLTRLRRVGT
jgi:dienelactone hydrolase